MSDGVAARAGTMRARPAFSMVSYIFAYCAIIGAFSISGYVTCGATVIANHHGVDARCRTVRINWYEGLDGLFQIKVFKANRRWSRQTRNGEPPLLSSVRVTLSQRKTSVARFGRVAKRCRYMHVSEGT